MAAISFPSSPSLNQIHTVGNRSWKYNGTAWKLVPRTTDAVVEGSTNLYFTNARVASAPAVTALEGRATAIEADITAIESAASTLAGRVGTAEGNISALQSGLSTAQSDIIAVNTRVDNVLSNVDGTALDSLSEVVTAFQAADSNLNGAITSLASTASTGLQNEINRATSVEGGLRTDVTALQSRAGTIESAATALAGRVSTAEGDITSLKGRASSLESRADSLEGRADSLESGVSSLQSGKQIKDVISENAPSHSEGRRWVDTSDMTEYLSYGGAWVELDKQ